jgi:cytochrome d ubiquinol oxidase subunit II
MEWTNIASGAAFWLPLIFFSVMGIAVLAYVLLDGYDLGVGLLSPLTSMHERNLMIASIGPFWDANETWLVLGVGILLVAFPMAHGLILQALYLPVVVLLIGLTLRGVSFELRVKMAERHRNLWDRLFFIGSLLMSLSQGYMLGRYISGFSDSTRAFWFSCFIALCVTASYALLGACWLIMKTEGSLQEKAIGWAKHCLIGTALGILVVSVLSPLINEYYFNKWFNLDNFYLIGLIPILTVFLFSFMILSLHRLKIDAKENNQNGLTRWCWAPFAGTVLIFILAFDGLAHSLFPYLVLGKITIWQAASATQSLWIILVGALLVLPMIVFYTVYAYRVFWGKVSLRDLPYSL